MANILDFETINIIQEHLNDLNHFELEARFTDYHYDVQKEKGIDFRTYQRLSEKFKNYTHETNYSTDITYKPKKIRYSYIPGEIPKEILIKKERVKGFPKYLVPYNIRIALSIENQLELTNKIKQEIINSPNEDKLTRIKDRISYFIGSYLRLDLTKVNTIEGNLTSTKYELELELLNKNGFSEWSNQLYEILRIIQDTEIVYTLYDYRNLIGFINKNLGGSENKTNMVDGSLVMDARNLKFRDLVMGGIVKSNPVPNENLLKDVNDPNYHRKINSMVTYKVTVKSDGLRKLLVINENGLWLVWGTEVNHILGSNPLLKGREGYIFDGELLLEEHRNENSGISEKYLYLIFDLICYNYNGIIDPTIRYKSHTNRMNIAEALVNYIKNSTGNQSLSNIQLVAKEFFYLNGVAEFYANMNEVNRRREVSPYKEDGFIFVPNECAYKRIKTPLDRRILTEVPDICKWKFAENITIDFALTPALNINKEPILKINGHEGERIRKFMYWDGQKIIIDPIFSSLLVPDSPDITITDLVNLKFDMSEVLSNSNVTFKWENNRYKGYPLNNPLDKLSLLKFNIDNRKDFTLKVNWITISPSKRVMELHHIQRTDYDNPHLNFVPIDKPVDYTHPMLKNIPHGFVVEFKWEPNKFVPIRLRHNKRLPNNLETIKDNLAMIEDPIELDTLLGKNIRLMRKYHNTIKYNLYKNYQGNLLDLGSGRGGDVGKWKNYKKIVAVEPNPSHIIRLKELIKKIMGLPDVKVITSTKELESITHDRIIILNTGAENYPLITSACDKLFKGEKADVISMMLSLSFFWSPGGLLNQLLLTISNNLKVGGVFIYLTVDGEKVKNTFDPNIKGPIIDVLNLLNGDVSMKYNKQENNIEVYFKGTIVEDEGAAQKEYLVLLKDLVNGFNNLGIRLDYMEGATKELLLNTSELEITRLYTYGVFVRTSESKLSPQINWLLKGDLIYKLKTVIKGINIIENKEEIKAKWYQDTLYRHAMIKFKNPKEELLSCILKATLSEYPRNVNNRFKLLDEHVRILKNNGIDLDTDILLEDLIVKLGNYYKVDISILQGYSNNIVPYITKYGNHPKGIIILKLEDGYENISVSHDNIIISDYLLISLFAITLISRLKLSTQEEYSKKFEIMYNKQDGKNTSSFINDLIKVYQSN